MKRALAILLLGLSIFSVSYEAGAGLLLPTLEGSAAIKGKMVDAVTGEPLEGVLIIATWHDFTMDYFNTQMEGGPHYSCYQLVNVLTAVSGPDGSFEFPRWSGKFGHCQFMSVNQPLFLYYKPGYRVLHSGDAAVDKEYVPGSDYTLSEWDGQTIRMNPLGPHYFGYRDSHVENLIHYSGFLDQAIREDENGPCFWKEESPALLMLFQEEHRLSAYAEDNLDLFEDKFQGPMTGRHCTDPVAVAALVQQAQATPPESPILPYVRFVGNGYDGTPDQGSAPPKELRDYILEERAPGHADHEKVVIYHVDVNPANPYYLALLRIGAGEDDVPPGDATNPQETREHANQGIYGFSCPAFSDIPLLDAESMSPSPNVSDRESRLPTASTVDYVSQMIRPTDFKGEQVWRRGPQRTGSDLNCAWTVALKGTDLTADLTNPVASHRDIYDIEAGTWTLTERSLVRPKEAQQPEILEIHGPETLSVTTTLDAVGPNRWRLPPSNEPFTLSVHMVRPGSDADDACVAMLPVSLRLQLARDYPGYRLSRASDRAAGAVGCRDVVMGDFTGKDTTGYAFHLLSYNLIQKLVVATPAGADWTITPLPAYGCRDPHSCALMATSPGIYVRTLRQWHDPNAAPHFANIDYGELAKLNALDPGFVETWDVQIAYAHFFVDGRWVYVTVDAPVLPTARP